MQLGDVLSERFEIERRAGSGGMGEVFRARDRASGEAVAVKVLLEERASNNHRFAREAAVLAELKHPGIVRYIAHGAATSGAPFLAMEWLDGEDLGTRLTRGVPRLGGDLPGTTPFRSCAAWGSVVLVTLTRRRR